MSALPALARNDRPPIAAEMIDAATVRVLFPGAAIIDNVQLLVLSPEGEALAALEPSLEERGNGVQGAVFEVPAGYQGEWHFLDVVFDHAVVERRALHTWSTRLVFRCGAAVCGASDEVEWGLAVGVLRLVTDPSGRQLLDADLRSVP